MKAIMVMFDSLNRHMLPPYGCDWVHAPNFRRLAERSVTFDASYVSSMPCMPARRELHTGRYNFLHRSWSPLEPFDDSMPEILKQNGVYTHLASDHYHYWEDGGGTYHSRYSSWEISRGQEGDPWIGDLNDPPTPIPNVKRGGLPEWNRHDWVNRWHMREEKDRPQPKTFAMGRDFLRRNHKHDNWFLQIETFDPHEPYFVPERFRQLYDFDFAKFADRDWPTYTNGEETPDHRAMLEHFRFLNAALISMCDEYLGTVLDAMDEHGLWDDTMLIVNTDHGFLLGEHDWWGKCRMPMYNEIANTPFFIWDPRCRVAGERRQSLVQTIDIAPTLLDFFGLAPTPDMQGRPLRQTLVDDTPVHDGGLFGIHGGQVNVTDGRHVYMRAPVADNAPLFEYTHMPCHMRNMFSVEEMQKIVGLAEPFSFTKGCRTMKIGGRGIPQGGWLSAATWDTQLFDVLADPRQEHPLADPAVEQRMTDLLVKLLRESDAPPEQYVRLGLSQ
jgi:arylsulfatase A-like enzyme